MIVDFHKSIKNCYPITLHTLYNQFVEECWSKGSNDTVFTILGNTLGVTSHFWMPIHKWHPRKRCMETAPLLKLQLPTNIPELDTGLHHTYVVAKATRVDSSFIVTLYMVEFKLQHIKDIKDAECLSVLSADFDVKQRTLLDYLPKPNMLDRYKDVLQNISMCNTGLAFTDELYDDNISGLTFNFLPTTDNNGVTCYRPAEKGFNKNSNPTFVKLFSTYNSTNLKKVGDSFSDGTEVYEEYRNAYFDSRESSKRFYPMLDGLRTKFQEIHNFDRTLNILHKLADPTTHICWVQDSEHQRDLKLVERANKLIHILHVNGVIPKSLSEDAFLFKISRLLEDSPVSLSEREQQLDSLLTSMVNGFLNGSLSIWEVEHIQRVHAALKGEEVA